MRVIVFILLLQSAYNFSRIGLYGGVGFDLATTEAGIHRGFSEGNPLLGQNRYQRMGLVIGTAILADLATRSLRRTNPRVAVTLNLMIGGIHGTAGVLNLRLMRR